MPPRLQSGHFLPLPTLPLHKHIPLVTCTAQSPAIRRSVCHTTVIISSLGALGLTGLCTGWIQLAEKSFPEILPHVSTCKSPQGMLGSMIKTFFAQQVQRTPEEIVYVSIMPCVRKQGEADRDVSYSHSASPGDGVYPADNVVHDL